MYKYEYREPRLNYLLYTRLRHYYVIRIRRLRAFPRKIIRHY